MTPESLRRRITQARGQAPADLVLANARRYDLVTGELREGDVAITGAHIVGVDADYDGVERHDLDGAVLVPGFVDTHLHVESSCVAPLEFDRCVLPRGTTTAICDPHEIANVAGLAGIDYLLSAAERTILDLRVKLSSCVPSSPLETSGASLDATALASRRTHPKVIGLAEFMNYPGVLARDPEALAKLAGFADTHVDGHAPLLSGRDLNAYIATGIRTEHEATTAAEALEKLAKGMHVLIREGSVSRDLAALTPLLVERHSMFVAFCTDDRNPLDIAEFGHVDHMVRTAIRDGAERLAVYRAASVSGARAFGLHDRGLVVPGQRADLVVLDDLDTCAIRRVYCGGRQVDEASFAAREPLEPIARASVHLPTMQADHFALRGTSRERSVIGVVPGKIITEHCRVSMSASHDGLLHADPGRDLAKIAVIERHGKNGNRAIGLVQGFGMQRGAIASTVCHDHHNLIVVGVDDQAMAIAANRIGEIEGGFVVADSDGVQAELALPIGGLMSLEPFETVHDDMLALRRAARALGVTLDEPFLQLAFLALPVIPHLKITDRGMVDVDRFALIEP